MTRRAWPELGRNLGAKLRLNELVLRRAGVERQQNQRGFGRGGGDRTQHRERVFPKADINFVTLALSSPMEPA